MVTSYLETSSSRHVQGQTRERGGKGGQAERASKYVYQRNKCEGFTRCHRRLHNVTGAISTGHRSPPTDHKNPLDVAFSNAHSRCHVRDLDQKNKNIVCAICGEASIDKLRVDHDPVSGKAIGILCGRCIMFLDLLNRDVETIRRAAAYSHYWIEAEVAAGLRDPVTKQPLKGRNGPH